MALLANRREIASVYAKASLTIGDAETAADLCVNFTILMSRSEPLLSNGTLWSVTKRSISSRFFCRRVIMVRGVGPVSF
jgi:hypothetical protein